MRRLAWALAVTTFVAAGGYSIVSLYRWEWTRALYFGLVFLAAEIGIVGALVLSRIGTGRTSQDADLERTASLIRESRPSANRFEWLEPMSGRMNVFITMLVGGGVVLSGLAWLIDRVASRTTTPAAERQLARRLSRIAYPRGGLVVDDVTVLAQAVPYCDDPQLRKLLRRAGHQR